MNEKDADWPSLPPIRTSSYNARVSCETLKSQTCPSTPASTSQTAIHGRQSASAGASPPCTSSSPQTSRSFCSCFPNRSAKGHSHDAGKKFFDTGGLLRSMFGPVAPRYCTPKSPYVSGVSPPASRAPGSSLSNSPSGHMKMPGNSASPINLTRSGGSTPHSTAVLRTSKGHAGHAFTMMPPDVVGKKKPPDYESDEPKSPEVTCIGKVRRKHCKATWDALVKEKNKKGKSKKKGKVKRLSGEMSPMCGETLRKARDGEKKSDCGELSFSGKLSKQRSLRMQSHDAEYFSEELTFSVNKLAREAEDKLHQDGCNLKQDVEQRNANAAGCNMKDPEGNCLLRSIPSSENCAPQSFLSSQHDCHHVDKPVPTHDTSTIVPPSNCLLLMKNSTRNRSSHHAGDSDFLGDQENAKNQWNWGQVLT